MRGEKSPLVASRIAIWGSTPHAWGKVALCTFGVGVGGLNPTCVGKSKLEAGVPGVSLAQPHMRGEKVSGQIRRPPTSGSTPHAWGKDFLTRRNTCKMSELLSLFPHGVSRRCPPTATFAPKMGTRVLMTTSAGDTSVYQALPQPEASAGFNIT